MMKTLQLCHKQKSTSQPGVIKRVQIRSKESCLEQVMFTIEIMNATSLQPLVTGYKVSAMQDEKLLEIMLYNIVLIVNSVLYT